MIKLKNILNENPNLDIKWPKLQPGEFTIVSSNIVSEQYHKSQFELRLNIQDKFGNTPADYIAPNSIIKDAKIHYYSNDKKFWTHDEHPNWDQEFKVKFIGSKYIEIDGWDWTRIPGRSPYKITREQAETINSAPAGTYKIDLSSQQFFEGNNK